MSRQCSRRSVLGCAAVVGAAAGTFAVVPTVGLAQMLVYDPSNYAQNVLQAARALEQINNQVTGLQNQARMLLNQARNLARLPYSSRQTIQQSFQRTRQLLDQVQRISFDLDQIDRTFTRIYPQTYSGTASSQQLASDAKERWQTSHAAFQDSLRVQAGVVQSLDTTRGDTDTLVAASQAAVGALQAAQAGNQLIALLIRQLADLTAVLAAQARADSLSGARSSASQEQARAQLDRFLTTGQGYQAQPVRMFNP
jgi:P-type conjugative transfer protein TrbJ